MKSPYKEQKVSNAAHLSPLLECVELLLYNYWVLSLYKLSGGYAAHLYSLLSIGRIAWYKLLSGYAAHLSPWKGEKERGLLMPNWRIKVKGWRGERVKKWLTPLHCLSNIVAAASFHLFTSSPFHFYKFLFPSLTTGYYTPEKGNESGHYDAER